MKKTFLTQLKSLSEIKMRKEERLAMRSALLLHIAPRPVTHTHRHAVRSPFVSFFTHMRAVQVIASILVLIVASSGSLAYASENTLPGDVLYPVKINITEKVESSLARTPEGKLAVAQTHIKRRLAEVKTLKQEGKLNKQTAQIAKDALLSHADDVKQNIAILVSEGKKSEVAQASTDIVATLTDFKKTELSVVTTASPSIPETVSVNTSAITTTPEPVSINPTVPTVNSTVVTVPPVTTPTTKDVVADTATQDSSTSPDATSVASTDEGISEITQAIDATVSAVSIDTVSATSDITTVNPVENTKDSTVVPVSVDITPVPETVTTTPDTTIDQNTELGSIHGAVTMQFSCTKDVDICPTPDPLVADRVIHIADTLGNTFAVKTQNDGKFVQQLPPGTYSLSIDTQEREVVSGIPETIVVTAHEASTINIVLSVLIR